MRNLERSPSIRTSWTPKILEKTRWLFFFLLAEWDFRWFKWGINPINPSFKSIEIPFSPVWVRPYFKGFRNRLFTTYASIFTYFCSIIDLIESREDWTPAQNARLDWVGVGDREKFYSSFGSLRFLSRPHPHLFRAHALYARFYG